LASVLVTISFLLVAARLFSHTAITRHPGVDDGFIALSWIFAVGVLVSFIMQSRHGLGYHTSDLEPEQIQNFTKWLWVTLWTYNGALSCTKFSLLFQYRRIFTTPWFQMAVKVLLGLMTVYSLWTFFGCIFFCFPISEFWTHSGNGKCLSTWPVFLGNSFINIALDLAIIMCPMPVLNSLNLPRKQKTILMGLFAVGGFVTIVSIVRAAIFIHSNGATDFSWINVDLGSWSIIEICVGIICTCVPSLKPILDTVLPRLFSS
ncbi:hypothetical protein K461DRAFT_211914, partial [Myriangium duriaei CBS 260.36]